VGYAVTIQPQNITETIAGKTSFILYRNQFVTLSWVDGKWIIKETNIDIASIGYTQMITSNGQTISEYANFVCCNSASDITVNLPSNIMSENHHIIIKSLKDGKVTLNCPSGTVFENGETSWELVGSGDSICVRLIAGTWIITNIDTFKAYANVHSYSSSGQTITLTNAYNYYPITTFYTNNIKNMQFVDNGEYGDTVKVLFKGRYRITITGTVKVSNANTSYQYGVAINGATYPLPLLNKFQVSDANKFFSLSAEGIIDLIKNDEISVAFMSATAGVTVSIYNCSLNVERI
jgi:hypothetical protein